MKLLTHKEQLNNKLLEIDQAIKNINFDKRLYLNLISIKKIFFFFLYKTSIKQLQCLIENKKSEINLLKEYRNEIRKRFLSYKN
jgi:hypothetical protein